MVKSLLIGFAGFVGTLGRYWLSGFVARRYGETFPLGTLVVNLLGCFLVGLLFYLMQERYLVNQNVRTIVLAGLLGGFTTFSSFGCRLLLCREMVNSVSRLSTWVFPTCSVCSWYGPVTLWPGFYKRGAMNIPEDGYPVRIFIGESDKHGHHPLYEAIVLKAREVGLAGATMTRGVMDLVNIASYTPQRF